MKDCGSKRPFVDNEPSPNAWKMSRTTPLTKVTNDPVIDDNRNHQANQFLSEIKNTWTNAYSSYHEDD